MLEPERRQKTTVTILVHDDDGEADSHIEGGTYAVARGEDATAMALADAVGRCGAPRLLQVLALAVEQVRGVRISDSPAGREVNQAEEAFVDAANRCLEAWIAFDREKDGECSADFEPRDN